MISAHEHEYDDPLDHELWDEWDNLDPDGE